MIVTGSIWKKVLEQFCQEATANRFLQYDPAEVAARFILALAVTEWGYEVEQFYDVAEVEKARDETSFTGFEKYTLLEEHWRAFNRGEPLHLRDNLIVLFMRGSLYPDDFDRDKRRATQLSRDNPATSVVMTSYERTDVFVGGHVVREYGIRDWEERFDELTEIFHAESGGVPEALPDEEEAKRLEEEARAMFSPLAEAFQVPAVRGILKRNPRKGDVHACVVQVLAYLLFLRACEETYPFERNFLRRYHWAYAGDGQEAYGDVALAGDIWADINRLIRGMGADAVLYPYLGYKFPDGALRRKLWSMIGHISSEAIQQVLGCLVTERFGLLRATHMGPVLGRLLSRVREDQSHSSDSTAILWLHVGDDVRQITPIDLRAFLEETYAQRIQPAFEAQEPEAVRAVAEWAHRLRVEERHHGGPIYIASAAEELTTFFSRINAEQAKLQAHIQQRTSNLFGAEALGSLGPSIATDRRRTPGGPFMQLVEQGILQGYYDTCEDAELAELALNTLNVLHADRSTRHPRLVDASHLRGYISSGYLSVIS